MAETKQAKNFMIEDLGQMREGLDVPAKDRTAFGIKNMEEIGMLKPLEKYQQDKRKLMKQLIQNYYTVSPRKISIPC